MANEDIEKLYNIYLNFKDNPKISFSIMKRHTIPKNNGCYIIFDKEGKSIYVGRSKGLRSRLNEHRRSDIMASSFRRKIKRKYSFDREEEITNFISKNCSFIFIEIDEKEVKRFEHFLIALLNPELND